MDSAVEEEERGAAWEGCPLKVWFRTMEMSSSSKAWEKQTF